MKRLAPAVLALALVGAACGSSAAGDDGVASLQDTSTTLAERSSDEIDAEEALLEFTQCLRDQGIDIEDPTVDADGNPQFGRIGSGTDIDRDVIRAAREECSESLENVALGFGGFDLTELQDTLLEFAQCMRDNGYDLPDPDFSNFGPPGGDDGEGSGRGFGPFGEIDPSDPDFQTASEACQDILAGFGPGGGGGRPPAGGQGGGNGGGGS